MGSTQIIQDSLPVSRFVPLKTLTSSLPQWGDVFTGSEWLGGYHGGYVFCLTHLPIRTKGSILWSGLLMFFLQFSFSASFSIPSTSNISTDLCFYATESELLFHAWEPFLLYFNFFLSFPFKPIFILTQSVITATILGSVIFNFRPNFPINFFSVYQCTAFESWVLRIIILRLIEMN